MLETVKAQYRWDTEVDTSTLPKSCALAFKNYEGPWDWVLVLRK